MISIILTYFSIINFENTFVQMKNRTEMQTQNIITCSYDFTHKIMNSMHVILHNQF